MANYAALQKIHSEAWEIVVTTFNAPGDNSEEGSVTGNVTTVTFTERLLRDILPLSPDQQTELCTELASGAINPDHPGWLPASGRLTASARVRR